MIPLRVNVFYGAFNPPSRSASADEKEWFNSPGLAPEMRVQGLPWDLIPFIKEQPYWIENFKMPVQKAV